MTWDSVGGDATRRGRRRRATLVAAAAVAGLAASAIGYLVWRSSQPIPFVARPSAWPAARIASERRLRIVDAAGAPASDVAVGFFDADLGDDVAAQFAAEGTFDPGCDRARASEGPWRLESFPAERRRTDAAGEVGIPVTSRLLRVVARGADAYGARLLDTAERGASELRLRPFDVRRVDVVGPDGAPVPFAAVELRRRAGAFAYERTFVVADAQGTATFVNAFLTEGPRPQLAWSEEVEPNVAQVGRSDMDSHLSDFSSSQDGDEAVLPFTDRRAPLEPGGRIELRFAAAPVATTVSAGRGSCVVTVAPAQEGPRTRKFTAPAVPRFRALRSNGAAETFPVALASGSYRWHRVRSDGTSAVESPPGAAVVAFGDAPEFGPAVLIAWPEAAGRAVTLRCAARDASRGAFGAAYLRATAVCGADGVVRLPTPRFPNADPPVKFAVGLLAALRGAFPTPDEVLLGASTLRYDPTGRVLIGACATHRYTAEPLYGLDVVDAEGRPAVGAGIRCVTKFGMRVFADGVPEDLNPGFNAVVETLVPPDGRLLFYGTPDQVEPSEVGREFTVSTEGSARASPFRVGRTDADGLGRYVVD